MIPAYELAINSSFRTRSSVNNCILDPITGLMGIVLDSFIVGLLWLICHSRTLCYDNGL